MKVKRVEPIAVSFPMKKPVFMAGVEIRQADNVLVRIESDDGVVGWGEAASAPTMTGETVESMMAAIGYLMPAVEGRPAEDIAGTLRAMATRMYATRPPRPRSRWRCTTSSAAPPASRPMRCWAASDEAACRSSA